MFTLLNRLRKTKQILFEIHHTQIINMKYFYSLNVQSKIKILFYIL